MKKQITLLVAFIATPFLIDIHPALAQDAADGHSIFDGETLQGWVGDPKFWRVENGAIVGQSTADNPVKANTFLTWDKGEVKDFEMSFKFRMDGGNSGVQIRSQPKDNFRVVGYQADFDAKNAYTGIFYDEGGRGILVPRCKQVTIDADGKKTVVDGAVDEATYLSGIKEGDWNEVVITAVGPKLTHSINGNVSAVLIDHQKDAAEASGILALQLHSGPPMKVEFKDLVLQSK
ncbi:MAG: DUF1080 domain-containing protein [Pirellulaceae bacterium]|nr:DUF1080 domain-containing protein [Pirellulaceae bacterium]MDG2103526.1 DUF1080 domain-containing protein [Pirellulaceae bacterium]